MRQTVLADFSSDHGPCREVLRQAEDPVQEAMSTTTGSTSLTLEFLGGMTSMPQLHRVAIVEREVSAVNAGKLVVHYSAQ